MALLEELADTREVVAPLFPGFGASEGLEHIDDIEDAAFHLLDVLDRLGFATCDLVGMSLGGWMAAELAVRWPERVRRMVLVNPVGLYVEGAPITEIFGRVLSELADELFADPDFPSPSSCGPWTAWRPILHRSPSSSCGRSCRRRRPRPRWGGTPTCTTPSCGAVCAASPHLR